MTTLTPSTNDEAVVQRQLGREEGERHGFLTAAEQDAMRQRCTEGIDAADRLVRAWAQGYATTAWQIAKDICMRPLDSIYGFLPHAPSSEADQSPFRFISCYQGQTEYHPLEHQNLEPGERLRFRWARCPWRWSFQQGRYWNYDSQELFERQFNDAHGLLMRGYAEPVDAKTLQLFRLHVCPEAKTGYYCHRRHAFVECEPTTESPSKDSYDSAENSR